ncbi:UTP--glucose-1-phosphate uridylyltransferase [Pelagicoccus sp. SDUM812002]|uniref:UTP--glucose-1-phosphate uridylyltransferase n=1 Tax=Pelagicoccus sp. SDUM812002 TaxID=3041266 RepID=UPI00280EBB1D|nr:UTP--glucose-1-phosphate uridylyltransferase [Pelagicoccus sp. SDUM812002]MDQ8188071.1 UTP--glucose-1-phosphate uridylyltransferase [Pelagicoccus sp. SDUM812002]
MSEELHLLSVITSEVAAERNRSLSELCSSLSIEELLAQADELEQFRNSEDSLYLKVRSLFFLQAIHRYHLPARKGFKNRARLSYVAHEYMLERRFEEAIRVLLAEMKRGGANDSLSSSLAHAYHALAFQTLADQVRQTVRSTAGNQWIFRMGHSLDHPLVLHKELFIKAGPNQVYPILKEQTAVRMDLTHCAWSDIFFLGMDFPEGARVLNVSVDLGVHGRDEETKPPIEAYFRVIEEPILRLCSVDLGVNTEISSVDEVFDFARDHLGLLKAAVIASGIVPPGLEGSGQSIASVFENVVGVGKGIEIVSNVNKIPKGSRLAVSTNLLGALIAVCMRASGQTSSLTGPLSEGERRIVAARAILGEWIGGSGGGWQDSGGIWPGIKLIEGEESKVGDSEYGTSRGCLLPRHTILGDDIIDKKARAKLQESLVLVHGGMAQNVGPILEMVTEKYLVRGTKEWNARLKALDTIDLIVENLKAGRVKELGELLTENFFGPLHEIIPWVSNIYTETLIADVRREFGDDFWGFWMLGGMSGGGMGFIFAPEKKSAGQQFLSETMLVRKRQYESALPFAMDPVVYDFRINENGSTAEHLTGSKSFLPEEYYHLTIPKALRTEPKYLNHRQRSDLQQYSAAVQARSGDPFRASELISRLLPEVRDVAEETESLENLLQRNGFDAEQHEQIRADVRAGRIGMAMNRLSTTSTIEDVPAEDLFDATTVDNREFEEIGIDALRKGEVCTLTFAAGVGSRWTQGAGVVKSLHPFYQMGGRHRNFIDIHLAKSRAAKAKFGSPVPHIFTSSYLTHAPIDSYLKREYSKTYGQEAFLSPGKSIGLRLVPTERDLRFAWEEIAQQRLDDQKQKMLESLRAALLEWARSTGEASDYTDNLPSQCLHPVGHWYEVPNLIKNGTLASLLEKYPNLNYILAHNIDTLGASLDPVLLGWHIKSEATLSFEVMSKRLDDRGGGLAKINGRNRLVEGLALPRESDEFKLTFYNTNTSWINVNELLQFFGLSRTSIHDSACVETAIRDVASRMPTYVTLKEVKKRWGEGQEDIFPISQFEKLWGDMTSLPELLSNFAIVPRQRGQQLKDQAQLDSWVHDKSASYVNSLCSWQ